MTAPVAFPTAAELWAEYRAARHGAAADLLPTDSQAEIMFFVGASAVIASALAQFDDDDVAAPPRAWFYLCALEADIKRLMVARASRANP